jgi:hypothetical protein
MTKHTTAEPDRRLRCVTGGRLCKRFYGSPERVASRTDLCGGRLEIAVATAIPNEVTDPNEVTRVSLLTKAIAFIKTAAKRVVKPVKKISFRPAVLGLMNLFKRRIMGRVDKIPLGPIGHFG